MSYWFLLCLGIFWMERMCSVLRSQVVQPTCLSDGLSQWLDVIWDNLDDPFHKLLICTAAKQAWHKQGAHSMQNRASSKFSLSMFVCFFTSMLQRALSLSPCAASLALPPMPTECLSESEDHVWPVLASRVCDQMSWSWNILIFLDDHRDSTPAVILTQPPVAGQEPSKKPRRTILCKRRSLLRHRWKSGTVSRGCPLSDKCAFPGSAGWSAKSSVFRYCRFPDCNTWPKILERSGGINSCRYPWFLSLPIKRWLRPVWLLLCIFL